MKQAVIISEPALCDLLSINDYYLLTVSDKIAAAIIDRLEATVNFPERGSIFLKRYWLWVSGNIDKSSLNLTELSSRYYPKKL
jgi:hypothetical protein